MRMMSCLLVLLALAGPAAGQMVIATIEVGNGPYALVYDTTHRKVFAALEGLNRVAVIDAVENQLVTTIPVGTHPSALGWSPTSGKLYVGNDILNSSGTVTVINTTDNSVITTLNVAKEPVAMAWNPTRNKLYVMNRGSSSVSVIDCATDRVTTTISLSQTLNAIVYNPVNDRIYVSSGAFQRPGVVHIIDCANDQATGSFNSGSNAGAMAVNPVRNRLYVANAASANLTVMNCANHTSLATIRTGNEPQGVIWTPDNRVFVTAYWDGKLHMMDGDSLRFSREVTLDGNPGPMLYNSNTEKLFVARPLQSTVMVIDARRGHEGRLIDDIVTGSGPKPMTIYPAQDQVYIANSWGRTITVLKDVIGVAGPEEPEPWGDAGRLSPSVARAAVRLHGPDPVLLHDRTGRSVAELRPGQNDIRRLPRGVYFARTAAGADAGKLVILD